MPQANANPAPPREPAWDIIVTRLICTTRPLVEACALDLATRFQSIGLGSDTSVRLTPRGLSTFLAVVGQRGLICIVDMTLVDGMVVGQGPWVALDIRLLDACGEVVEDGMSSSELDALSSGGLDPVVTAVYVAALAHFDLMSAAAR